MFFTATLIPCVANKTYTLTRIPIRYKCLRMALRTSSDLADQSFLRQEKSHDSCVVYRKNSNTGNRTVCYVVRNFLLWKGGEKHTKNLPFRDKRKRKKALDPTRRGKSNVLSHGPIIRVLTVGNPPSPTETKSATHSSMVLQPSSSNLPWCS